MSERFNVDMDDVLGSNYFVASIGVNEHNPSIEGTVTLTVTLKDVYGDNVSGESVTVTCSDGGFTGWPTSSSAGTGSWNSFGGSSAYASSCRPTQYRTFLNAGATLYWRINTDGTIEYRSTSGTVSSGTSVYTEIEWAIRDADL